MENTETLLEFNKIRELWMQFAITKWAKEEIQKTTPFLSETELLAKQRETKEARMTFDRNSLKPLYQLVIGEAGESCAFYIAARLGMPRQMLEIAVNAAYGKNAPENQDFLSFAKETEQTHSSSALQKKKTTLFSNDLHNKFQRGDSVMIYPDKKIGIVCQPIDKKGMLQIQHEFFISFVQKVSHKILTILLALTS